MKVLIDMILSPLWVSCLAEREIEPRNLCLALSPPVPYSFRGRLACLTFLCRT